MQRPPNSFGTFIQGEIARTGASPGGMSAQMLNISSSPLNSEQTAVSRPANDSTQSRTTKIEKAQCKSPHVDGSDQTGQERTVGNLCVPRASTPLASNELLSAPVPDSSTIVPLNPLISSGGTGNPEIPYSLRSTNEVGVYAGHERKNPNDLLVLPTLEEGSGEKSNYNINNNFAALDQMIQREIEEARKAVNSVFIDPTNNSKLFSDEGFHNNMQTLPNRVNRKATPNSTVSQELTHQIDEHMQEECNETRESSQRKEVDVSSDEKKEATLETQVDIGLVRRDRLADLHEEEERWEEEEQYPDDLRVLKTVSTVESDVASLDGLPSNLQPRWKEGATQRDIFMQKLDGIDQPQPQPQRGNEYKLQQHSKEDLCEPAKTVSANNSTSSIFPFSFDGWSMNILCGGDGSDEKDDSIGHKKLQWKDNEDSFAALLGCAPVVHSKERARPMPIPTSLVRVTSEPPPQSYAEAIHSTEVDERMQAWVDIHYMPRAKPPMDGSYSLGKSKTVVVHEIVRGDWTWCTAWSPEGNRLAIATENHHIAVVDTVSSPVWRVLHDKRITGPVKNEMTHSIRSIAWGSQFIAIGGSSNVVSILSPVEPYPVLHTIKGTGFVGSLHWKIDSNILAIGSRLDKAILVKIGYTDVADSSDNRIQSELLHTIDCKHWVNCVAFSPGGSCLAIGDASGLVSIFSVVEEPEQIATFTMEDSILAVEWSPDGKWLYAGGEDFRLTVIDTNCWEIINSIQQKRWVQCIASSSGGSHLAVGGVSSEITLFEVGNNWDSILGIELKGLVPLSAKWHPNDHYLALTGQNNSVLAVETTNSRHVRGHHLHSISPILSIEFSPDGRMVAIGNKVGVVTFFSLSGSTFVTAYELVVASTDRVSIKWSVSGLFVVIGSKDALVVVGHSSNKEQNENVPPSASGFSIRKVVRDLGEINAVSIDPHSHYVAISGERTLILDSTIGFKVVREWKSGPCQTNAWSPDGRWLATMGHEKVLTIYNTRDERVDRWGAAFSLQCDFVGLSLSWAPEIVRDLLYLAYGGKGENEITIMEIRTLEGTWEKVLRIPRDGAINGLDWSADGLLAAAIGDGTVSIVDLAYLQSGVAVNEMDYNWQRQALASFTEIRRNRGSNSMQTVRWIPSAPGSDSLLAIGGSDGELEIVDLTERQRCRGSRGYFR